MPHEGAKTHNIPFADFIAEFTTETLTWMDHVPGLRPQVETCSVCDVTWDAIVKLESWAEDFEVSFPMFEQDRFFRSGTINICEIHWIGKFLLTMKLKIILLGIISIVCFSKMSTNLDTHEPYDDETG